jgi:membrane protease YdiL (CAAX protease family)
VRPRLASGLATVGVLAYAALAPWFARRHAALAAAGASAAAVGVARAAGLSWGELGLAPGAACRGAGVGVAVALPIAAGVIAGSRHEATRGFFSDARVVELNNRDAAYELFVRIPVVTAATEELLFRSVLYGVSEQWLGPRRAAVWTSLVFGVWHVVPALHAHRHNPGAADALDGMGGRGALVAGTVAATAAAGFGLCALRRRTNSVVAPVIVHAAINGAAFAAARNRFGVRKARPGAPF